MAYHTLRLVLGDQLNAQHSWFRQPPDNGVLYVLMEVRSEQTYVRHHVQKIALFFAAMRHFAESLQAAGHQVHYLRITDPTNQHTFPANLQVLLAQHGIRQWGYQQPDEYRLDRLLADFAQAQGLPVEVADTEHFLTSRTEAQALFGNARHWLMERFYRHMRQRTGYLMEGGKPLGGRWNYDHDNRKALPAGYTAPPPPDLGNDFGEVLADIRAADLPRFGAEGPIVHPISRQQALLLLDHFCQVHLPHFGTWQDAMAPSQPFLHHSLLSFALNVKLLHPQEVIETALATWQARPQAIALNQIEGFVRQILGWREYVRGIYWAHMPHYATRNTLQATRPLPHWYWTGHTHMRCLHHAISDSLQHAYAHHIQRLMLTGNFATLAGIAPAEVNAWYLGIYADALEWVQLPNTHGMSLFADDGLIATKPYVSGGSYIRKMSSYCKGCAYDPTVRHGPRACPFSSLYWHFLARHEARLRPNPRLAQMYATWYKLPAAERAATLAQADAYLERVEGL